MSRSYCIGLVADIYFGVLQELDFETIHGTARSLILAGSETTASLLCGVTFLLLTNAEALVRVKKEVRSAFNSEKEITLLSVNSLSYMLACINEALRLYPPIPSGLPRYTPPGGAVIAGHNVPENVRSRLLFLEVIIPIDDEC